MMAQRFFALLLFGVLVGCAAVRPGFEQPSVTLNAFKLLPAEGMVPRFEIGLRVVNPNRAPLVLEGVSYTVALEGHRLLTGVSNQLPVIEGYGSGDITLLASPDLIGGMRLLGDLMGQQREQFRYQLDAKLDVGALLPAIRVSERGEIALKAR